MKSLTNFINEEKIDAARKCANILKKEANFDNSESIAYTIKDILIYIEEYMQKDDYEEMLAQLNNMILELTDK